jgi:NAD(P)-dependent dehydrogenase (short-subunit alcohol dehydrogenase family)
VSSSAAAQAHNDGRWQYMAADYDRKQAYAKSKLANLLFAFELARRLQGSPVQSMAADPGLVATRFARNNGLVPWLKHLVYHGMRGELLSPAAGADTVVFLAATATLPPLASGGYFRERQLVRASPAAYDTNAAAGLWQMSAELCRVDPAPGREWPPIDPAQQFPGLPRTN